MNTITNTLNTTSALDNPYLDMVDPELWDNAEKMFTKVVDALEGTQVMLPLTEKIMPVITPKRRQFAKFCGKIEYKMNPMSNGVITLCINFTPKKQNNYSVERLQNEVRHIRDAGLDFAGMPLPTGDRIPDLLSLISGSKDKVTGEHTIRLTFLPKGSTINGVDMYDHNGEFDISNGKAVKTGELTEAR